MKCILTDKLIREHKLGTTVGRQELCDQNVKRLYAEVRATSPGQASFYLRSKDASGKTFHTKLGRSDEIDVSEARRRAKKLKAEILLGRDPHAEINARKSIPTIAEFAQDTYLPFVTARKATYRNDEANLRLHILPVLGNYRLDQLKRHQIETWHSNLLSTMSGASADHALKVLKFMYTKAQEQGLCQESPAKGAKLFNFDNKIERYLDDAELQRLMAVLQNDRNRHVANAILFLLATGLRLNSCLTAEWKNVDRKNKTLTIDAIRSKNRRKLVIPLNSLAMSVLDDLGTQGMYDYLFINPRTKRRLTTLSKTFKRILADAQIENFRIHDLRHCFCSYALQSGRSIAEVSQLAGHSSVQVTMRYAHFAKGQLHDASNSTAAHIAAAIKSSS